MLHHYLDLPIHEVAARLGVPVGTASSRYHRALRSMRTALDADGHAAGSEPLEAMAR